ncbi:type II toxin-antitoxin system HicB family antitoxin [Lactobacillus helveticus]|jgi:predicted HicB family RNase H-like nuclease|uniref:HicB family protein n=2 Tax=Lactobacillus helveticus TaxID=1587 RepID=A0A3S8SC62_LACHE|nr:type II toxin-antitoxin system HicB family antitoxin [Lactobacillus helveticus]AFR22693.1 HicB protein [Lactobacillus helveticus R0052]AZK91376.1 HicB family protein [Lactobacillus helveticus]MCJ2191194.1 type II toxin-antitoxin system HicB family antitoxin [Lactobacillus helveticus]NRO51394.1 hypothetical protein [Lactobacillus helveticus]NRO69291.1 hypothetical protein [Lactobacillus helveticus]
MKMLHYKDYYGTVNISEEDNVLYGKVIGIKGLLSYEGETVEELKQDFHNVVDEYIADCKRNNIKPQVSYKGTFNVRITPELHKDLVEYAEANNESLNSAVTTAIERLVLR